MPEQLETDPYHAFLSCPKCKQRKLKRVLLNESERIGRGKKDRATMICDNCGFDLGKNRQKKVKKSKPVIVKVKL